MCKSNLVNMLIVFLIPFTSRSNIPGALWSLGKWLIFSTCKHRNKIMLFFYLTNNCLTSSGTIGMITRVVKGIMKFMAGQGIFP